MKKIETIINNIVASKKDYDVLVVDEIINQNKPMQNKLSRIKKLNKKINNLDLKNDFLLFRDLIQEQSYIIESLSKDIQNWIKKHNRIYMAMLNSLIEEGRKLLGE